MGVKAISGIFLISILLIAGGCQVGGRQGVEDPSPYVVYFSVIDPGGKGAGAIIYGSSYIRIEGLEIRSNMVYGTTDAGGDITPAPLYADNGALTDGYSVNTEKV
jgi:hypothetical protein